MPIKIAIDGKDEIILDIVEFIQNDDFQYFRVYNNRGVELNFEYVPISTSSWDKNLFDIYLFQNPYLNAENDVFQVYEDSLDERAGWIFPITILESNDNDYKEKSNLNNYKYIAYQKLLELDVTITSSAADFMKLTDLYKDVSVCLLSKEVTKKIDHFNIENYILSFYRYGYSPQTKSIKPKSIYDKSGFIKDMRDNRSRIKLTKSQFNIASTDFTKALFLENLLQSDSYIIRFIFLYQIIEHLIQVEFDQHFQNHLDNYHTGKLGKNDLKEQIINSSRERDLIKSIFDRVNLDSQLKSEFTQECDFLFSDIGLTKIRESFPDKIYDLRNIFTHNLRLLTSKEKSVIQIMEIFERVMISFLINHE